MLQVSQSNFEITITPIYCIVISKIIYVCSFNKKEEGIDK